MESHVIEENIMVLHIMLQELTRSARGLFPDIRAEDTTVRHGRQLDSRCRSHGVRNECSKRRSSDSPSTVGYSRWANSGKAASLARRSPFEEH